MNIIDLTMPVTLADKTSSIRTEEWKLSGQNGASYTGIVHEFKYSSMCGTYIDFPGHIKETDDGMDAMNCPADKFLRMESAVIHLNKESENWKSSHLNWIGMLKLLLKHLVTQSPSVMW